MNYSTFNLTSGLASIFLTNFLSVQLQIEEISRKLRTGELTVGTNPEERFEIIIFLSLFLSLSKSSLFSQIIIH